MTTDHRRFQDRHPDGPFLKSHPEQVTWFASNWSVGICESHEKEQKKKRRTYTSCTHIYQTDRARGFHTTYRSFFAAQQLGR